MPTRPITPRLAESLNRRLLAASQLQIQAARSVALDASALGVMAVDAAVAALVIGARGMYGLWIVALVLLGLSLGLAVRTLYLPGATQIGPSVTDTPEVTAREDERSSDDSLLNDLANDIEINGHAIARKEPLFDLALWFLVLAILVALIGALP